MGFNKKKNQWTLFFAGICVNTAFASDMLASLDGSEFNLPEFDEFSVPVVLTATRIQQHQADVPASVTILDSDLIKQIAPTNLADLLRYVPGMMIGPDRNNNGDSVYYHGGPTALPKNLQVLLNGRSMYRTGLASVSWFEMPVAIEDISRIEVVRGPNSASYGANAYQAIINILTKHPADTYGSSVSYQYGNNGENNVYLKQGGQLADMDYRLSYVQKSTDLYEDYVDDDECSDGCPDDRISQFINLESSKSLNGSGELDISLVAAQAVKEISNPADFQTNQNKISEDRYELGARFTRDLSSKHQLLVKTYVTQFNQRQAIDVGNVPLGVLDDDLRALFLLNPQAAMDIAAGNTPTTLDMTDAEQFALASTLLTRYANPADGLIPVSGTVNADIDEYRFDIEVQDTYVFSPELTLVSGFSYRYEQMESLHFFDENKTNETSRIFASATWAPIDSVSTHLGVMGEKESSTDLVFAPRAAVNYKFTPSQSVRLVYSESVRSPDFFEQEPSWKYTVDNAVAEGGATLNGTTYFATAQGPEETIDHQKIKSYELGYYGRLTTFDSEVDIRLFKENLSNVLFQSIKIEDLRTYEDNEVTFQGIEWQMTARPFSDTQFRFTGAYVDVELPDTNTISGQRLVSVYARNSGTVSWFQNWTSNTRSSLSCLMAAKYDQLNNDPDDRGLLERVELVFAKDVLFYGHDLELTLTAQHDTATDTFAADLSVYEDDTRVQLGARFNF